MNRMSTMDVLKSMAHHTNEADYGAFKNERHPSPSPRAALIRHENATRISLLRLGVRPGPMPISSMMCAERIHHRIADSRLDRSPSPNAGVRIYADRSSLQIVCKVA
jgi:hypothetical protein